VAVYYIRPTIHYDYGPGGSGSLTSMYNGGTGPPDGSSYGYSVSPQTGSYANSTVALYGIGDLPAGCVKATMYIYCDFAYIGGGTDFAFFDFYIDGGTTPAQNNIVGQSTSVPTTFSMALSTSQNMAQVVYKIQPYDGSLSTMYTVAYVGDAWIEAYTPGPSRCSSIIG